MAYEPLHHKYRPQTLDDLVGQETIALTLSNALEQAKIAPAYLFTGPRGTGKTSSARILAKSLNCLASDRPTPHPCGKCEVCLAIAKGVALDVMEIDAASNTGVDNIREIIERSRFAPVQCRYKIYAIDECLTGDSLIQTDNGLMRIDDPNLQDKRVLSYDDNRETWDYKKVVRWLKRGTKKTLTIKTGNFEISCTENHLIRTETGWIEAGNVKEGMKILSPVNVDIDLDVASIFTSLEKVESVSHGGHEKVYDLEVEDNHNFVANGLLVHNCHMLSTAAFNALLKTLEEPPPQVVFILATTDPQRVLSTIISRCQRFDYRRIPLKSMTNHLRYIADTEKIAIADDALTLVAQISNGGLRDAESLLDQLSLLPEMITVEKVWDLVGAVPEQDLLKLLQGINSNDSLAVLQQCRSLLDRGREPLVVLQNLASFYLNLLIAKTAPQHAELTAVTETCWQQLCEEGKNWQTALILRGQQHLKEAETQLKRTTQPRLWLEVTLLGLLPEVHSAIAVPPQTITPNPVNPTVATTPSIPNTPVAPTRPQNTSPTGISPQDSPALTTPVKSSPPPQGVPDRPPHQPTAIAQTSPVVAPEVVAPEVVAPEVVAPEVVAPSNNQDPVANQQIWSKVVSCLQPPTTEALLKQRCHLVSFDGMSAIVGISSATLQKLHQGKVPNIEAAFAQVCQRKVRVQLEVANSKGNQPQNLTAPINQPIAEVSHSVPQQPPSPPSSPPPSPVKTQIVQPTGNSENIVSQTLSKPPTSPAGSSAPNSQIANQPQAVGTKTTSVLNPLEISKNVSLGNNGSQVNLSQAPLVNHAETVSHQDYGESNLQQAIDSLTQSFAGEVVQLDNALDEFFDTEDADISSESAEAIPLGRPTEAEYDDDW